MSVADPDMRHTDPDMRHRDPDMRHGGSYLGHGVSHLRQRCCRATKMEFYTNPASVFGLALFTHSERSLSKGIVWNASDFEKIG